MGMTLQKSVKGDAGNGIVTKHDESPFDRHERMEQRWMAVISSPAAMLVTLVIVIPLAGLLGFSFIDESGRFTLENYTAMTAPIYRRAFFTTIELSASVTAGVVILGYPLCYMMRQLPTRAASICVSLVLLPFWTSTLVRTYAWLVILQRQGILNTILLKSGLINSPLQLIYNFSGTTIGLVHIMLPFFVLPLYNSMSAIDGNLLRAAANCGASPTKAFWRIFFPLTIPGLSAGLMLVFVLCLGFYVTPAILGGGKVLMWSMQIESALTFNPSWGAPSALGIALMILTMIFLVILRRLTDKTWRQVA